MSTEAAQDTRGTRARAALVLAALIVAALAAQLLFGARPTVAQDPQSAPTSLSIAEPVERSCFERQLPGAAGTATATLPGAEIDDADFGAVIARLDGPSGGDWDLAVFDSAGEVVAAGSSRAGDEVASGYLTRSGELTVQACRISGPGREAQLTVETELPGAGEVEKASLVTVDTPRRSDKELVQSLDLDLTEHGGEDHVAVVLHGAEDAAKLEKVGLEYEVEVANLGRQAARQSAKNDAFAAETARSSLPSGSDTYRRLFHYAQELKDLAEKNPDLVRPITLNHKTYEGRTVEGIEITTDPDNRRDGKPVFLQMGLHHAREWPSGEHAIEWAYELIKGYKRGDNRVRRLVENTRTIVIPVINPDGFNASREAGQQQGSGNGEDGTFLQAAATSYNEYRRKNCRIVDASQTGNCNAPAFGVASIGVDPNRNYGGFWGGPGASDIPAEEDFRGPGPFSEPETQNVRELLSARQVTVLITNHTFSNLVLRPPSIAADPLPADEPIYKALGEAMAGENGYLNQHSYELYDTSGATEDWSYFATGGLGFTFEIYCNHIPDPLDERCSGNFHPTYSHIVDEYEGAEGSDAPPGGGGNRAAYFLAHEAAADPAMHSVLESANAPPGAILKIEKSFTTPTRNEDQPTIEDHLESELKVSEAGRFDWHINPSTRPLVAIDRGRVAQGPPSEPSEASFTPAPTGTNATTTPCASFDTDDEACWNDHAFTVPDLPDDNDSATVELNWSNPVNDWDLKVFPDPDGDGKSVFTDTNGDGSTSDEADAAEVAQSGNSPPGTNESATFARPETADGRLAPGKYVARVINYAAITPDPYTLSVEFHEPEQFVPARTETWKLSCTYLGEQRFTQEILIRRGERQRLDLRPCGTGAGGAGGGGGGGGGGGPASSRCQGEKVDLVGTTKDDTMIGTPKRDVIVSLGGKDEIRGGGGDDVICAKGGNDRISGGSGNDKLKAGSGKDKVRGASGNDRLNGGSGKDEVNGNGGQDTLRGGPGKDQIRGGGGEDACQVKGTEVPRGCE